MGCKNLQGIILPTWKYEANFLVTYKSETKPPKPKSLWGGREGGGETAGSHKKDSKPESAVNCVAIFSANDKREGKLTPWLGSSTHPWEVYYIGLTKT